LARPRPRDRDLKAGRSGGVCSQRAAGAICAWLRLVSRSSGPEELSRLEQRNHNPRVGGSSPSSGIEILGSAKPFSAQVASARAADQPPKGPGMVPKLAERTLRDSALFSGSQVGGPG